MTSKGQITIPLEIRERYGLEQGTQCLFIALDDQHFEIMPKRPGAFLEAAAEFAARAPAASRFPATNSELHEAIGDWLVEDDERISREQRSPGGEEPA